METLLDWMMRVLVALFLVGVGGCLLVIPRTAVELFASLFQPDLPDELSPHGPPAPTAGAGVS